MQDFIVRHMQHHDDKGTTLGPQELYQGGWTDHKVEIMAAGGHGCAAVKDFYDRICREAATYGYFFGSEEDAWYIKATKGEHAHPFMAVRCSCLGDDRCLWVRISVDDKIARSLTAGLYETAAATPQPTAQA